MRNGLNRIFNKFFNQINSISNANCIVNKRSRFIIKKITNILMNYKETFFIILRVDIIFQNIIK